MDKSNERIRLLRLLQDAFSLLARKDKRQLTLLTAVQIVTGFLDLIALGFIGLLTTLALQPSLAVSKGSKVYFVLHFLHVNSKPLS